MFDADGSVLALAQHEFTQHFPAPGHVEHDALEIVETQLRAAEEAHAQAGAPEILGVGITNQRETVVVFDRRTGEPIHRALVWQDRRTEEWLAARREHADSVRALTGLPMDPYFSAAKIAWILDHVDGARDAAARGELAAGTIDAWLVYKLTDGQVFATEPSNASRTSLFDIHRGEWSDELCELFGVPRAMLPDVRDSAADFGTVVGKGWPIRAVLGDQQSALFGHAATAPGDSKCTYGTGAFWLTNAGTNASDPAHGLLSTVAWSLGGERTYAVEGSVMVAGALVQWLRDGLGIVETAGEIEALARSVDDSGGVVIVPAFAGLGTPHWDADARGLIVGLTRGTERAHLARAALEALALQVHDVLEAVGVSGARPKALHVDGGATANTLLLQMQATISGLPVVRPANLETTALGVARMAMVGAGACRTPADLPVLPPPSLRVEPGRGIGDRTGLCARWASAVERSKGWASLG